VLNQAQGQLKDRKFISKFYKSNQNISDVLKSDLALKWTGIGVRKRICLIGRMGRETGCTNAKIAPTATTKAAMKRPSTHAGKGQQIAQPPDSLMIRMVRQISPSA
jgi:hypothetical protein